MKKTTFILFFLLFTTLTYSQFRGREQFSVSFGINVLDNSAFQAPLQGTEQWSFNHPITVGVEYRFDEHFSVNPMLSFNAIDEVYVDSGQAADTGLPNGWIDGGNYFSFDVNGKFYFDEYIAENEKIDAYAGLGLGYFSVADESNGSGNINIGIKFWIKPAFGVRLQSLAKFAFDNDKVYANNNFLHTLDFIYRF